MTVENNNEKGTANMARHWPRRQSRRERIEGINNTFRLNAILRGGTPEQMAIAERLCTDLPKKREVRRPVDGKPVGRSEHQEQCAVISWWSVACLGYGLPRFALFAIPNGGARDAITGARLKAEGVRRGVFDLNLAASSGQYHGLFIEMKVGSNKPSPEQQEFRTYLDGAGYKTAVCYDSKAAISTIEEYLKAA